MRILRIIARLNIGGPAIQAVLLSGPDVELQYRSKLVCGNIGSSEGDMSYLAEQKGVAPIIIPELGREISPWKDVSSFMALRGLIRNERPHIVHTHTAKAGTLGRLAILSLNLARPEYKKIKTVHTFHGHVFEGYFSKTKSLLFVWIERLLAMATDVIIAISDTQKRDLAEKYHIAPVKKIKTIGLGFDLMPFLNNGVLRGRFRGNYGIPEDILLIGIVGRLVPIKNHRIFFQAARQFVEQNPGLKVQFMVVGDGELRDESEAYCRRLGLADLVIFCGWVKDVHLVYADLDILALTSLNEGTPVSIIEAMASSVPVIATDAGGVPDLLGPSDSIPASDGFTVCERGILCRNDDASGFARGLKYLVDIDESQKHRRITQARSFVQERFSEERLIRDMESLYLDLTANRG
jgi:glycosyltransferase involved in cell wall biosynthesis